MPSILVETLTVISTFKLGDVCVAFRNMNSVALPAMTNLVGGTDALNSHDHNVDTCHLWGSPESQFKASMTTLSQLLVCHLSNSPDSLSCRL